MRRVVSGLGIHCDTDGEVYTYVRCLIPTLAPYDYESKLTIFPITKPKAVVASIEVKNWIAVLNHAL